MSSPLPTVSVSERAVSSVLELIGRTPLIRLTQFEHETPGVELYAKAEWHNPGGSVKDRAAARMILEGEKSGRLRPGLTMSSLAATTGMHDEALQRLFSNIESLYVGLLDEFVRATSAAPRANPSSIDGFAETLRSDCRVLLELSPATTAVLASGLNSLNLGIEQRSQLSLGATVGELLESRYVTPLVAAKYDHDEILATVLGAYNCVLALVRMVRQQNITRTSATARALVVLDALMRDTAQLSSNEESVD